MYRPHCVYPLIHWTLYTVLEKVTARCAGMTSIERSDMYIFCIPTLNTEVAESPKYQPFLPGKWLGERVEIFLKISWASKL